MSKGKTLVVTGATGLVDVPSFPKWIGQGGTARILSRSEGASKPNQERFVWDGIDPGGAALAGADAIVHLAGESIFRWLADGGASESEFATAESIRLG